MRKYVAAVLILLGIAAITAIIAAGVVIYAVTKEPEPPGLGGSQPVTAPVDKLQESLKTNVEPTSKLKHLAAFAHIPPAPPMGPFVPLSEHIEHAGSFHYDDNPVPIAKGLGRDDYPTDVATELPGLKAALLVCTAKFLLNRRIESFGGTPEPALRMRFANQPTFLQRRNKGYFFSVPGIELERGDTATFRLFDQDPRRLQPLGRAKVTFDGSLPLVARSKSIEVTCRPVDHETLAERAQASIDTAEQRIHTAVFALDEAIDTLDFPSNEVDDARRAIGRLASLVGWADPRVLHLKSFWRQVEEKHQELARATATDAYQAAAERGEWRAAKNGRVEARLTDSRCSPKLYRWYDRHARYEMGSCRLDVEFRNLDAEPLVVHYFFDEGYPEVISVVHESGISIPLDRDRFLRDDAKPEPRKSLQVEKGDTYAIQFRASTVRPEPAIMAGDPADVRWVRVGTKPSEYIDLKIR